VREYVTPFEYGPATKDVDPKASGMIVGIVLKFVVTAMKEGCGSGGTRPPNEKLT